MQDTTTTLQSPIQQSSLDEIITEIFRHRRINKKTQQILMSALLGKSKLNAHDEAQVQKVFEALHRGSLRVVD